MTLVICALWLVPSWTQAQDLVLTKNNREKKFPTGQFIQVSTLAVDTISPGSCSQNYYYGKLLNSDSNVLKLQVTFSYKPIYNQEDIFETGYNRTFFKNISDGPVLSIPKDEIIWVIKSGKNKPKNTSTGQAIGASIAGAGFIVAIIALAEDYSDTRNDVLSVGAYMIVAGWVMAELTQFNPRYVQEHCSHKKKGQALWTIQ